MDARYAAVYPDLYARHWWWRAREAILLKQIGRLLRGVPDARILDVGCGAGMFFEALEVFGRVEGIESDRTSVERSGRWRERIHVGDLDGAFVPAAPYDLIMMLDVLEHIHRPEDVLMRAREVLRPNGRILITVPAFTWLWTSHDDLNHHVTRYSTAALRDVIARSGLATQEAGYLFQSLVVPKLLVRAKEAVFSAAPRVPTVPPPAMNQLIRAWFLAEHAIAGWLPFGGSAFAIASHASVTSPPRSRD